MIQIIQLNGNDDDLLAVTLHEIIACLPNGIEPYWSLLEIEGMGYKEKVNVASMENIINSIPVGLHLNLKSIIGIVDNLTDIHNLLIIGDDDISKLIRYNSIDEAHRNCTYCIHLIDSSYWEISTYSKEFADNLLQRLA